MDFDSKDLFAAITLLVSVIGVWKAYIEYKRKSDIEIFERYTKKYHEVLDKSILQEWNAALYGGDVALQEKHKLVMVGYLNLVWEEYYLFRQNILPNRLWDMWVDEINEILSTDFAQKVISEFKIPFSGNLKPSLKTRMLRVF